MFDFTLHSTIYNMQNLMVDIYDYFKDKLDGRRATVETSPSSKIIGNLVVLLVLIKTRRFFLFKYSFLRLILRNSARCLKSILL